MVRGLTTTQAGMRTPNTGLPNLAFRIALVLSVALSVFGTANCQEEGTAQPRDSGAPCSGRKNSTSSIPYGVLHNFWDAMGRKDFEAAVKIARNPGSGLTVGWLSRDPKGRIIGFRIADRAGCTVATMELHAEGPIWKPATGDNRPLPLTHVDTRSQRFQLRERTLGSGGVVYDLDGSYIIQPHAVVVTIDGGRVVADQDVVLHSLRVGVCGYADGQRVDVFSKDIPLKETRLANGSSYKLEARTVRIPFTKTPPAMNGLCSILSGSAGDSVAEALGSVDFAPRPATRFPQQAAHPLPKTALASVHTEPKLDEFWKRRKPAEWSDEERRDFLTKSPWVHYYANVLAPSCVVGPKGRRGLVPAPDMSIRWESAAMVREALARVESKEYKDALAAFSKDYFLISVIHFTKGRDQSGFTSHWSREQEEEFRNASQAQAGQPGSNTRAGREWSANRYARQVFTTSWLLGTGGQPISPARVESGTNAEGTVDLLMFPRDLELEKGEGDVDFKTTLHVGMGFSKVSVKFELKDLTDGIEPDL